MAIQIADNFKLSLNKSLDNRIEWESLATLKNNTDILMPIGFITFCKNEKTHYVLKSATDEFDPSTYKWEVFNNSTVEDFVVVLKETGYSNDNTPDTTTITCDKTFTDILTAYKSGKIIKATIIGEASGSNKNVFNTAATNVAHVYDTDNINYISFALTVTKEEVIVLYIIKITTDSIKLSITTTPKINMTKVVKIVDKGYITATGNEFEVDVECEKTVNDVLESVDKNEGVVYVLEPHVIVDNNKTYIVEDGAKITLDKVVYNKLNKQVYLSNDYINKNKEVIHYTLLADGNTNKFILSKKVNKNIQDIDVFKVNLLEKGFVAPTEAKDTSIVSDKIFNDILTAINGNKIVNITLKKDTTAIASNTFVLDEGVIDMKVSYIPKDNTYIEFIGVKNIDNKPTTFFIKMDSTTTKLIKVQDNTNSGIVNCTASIDVGGIKRGDKFENKDINEVIKALIDPYQLPEITAIYTNDNKKYYHINEALNHDLIIKTNIIKKTSKIKSVEFLVNNISKNILNGATVENGGAFECNIGKDFTTDTEFKVKVIDENNKVVEKSNNFYFVHLNYVACNISINIGLNDLNIDDIKNASIKKVLTGTKEYTWDNINCTNMRPTYMYYKDYGVLSSIKDGNGFEYINSFDTTIKDQYRIYILKNTATLKNGVFIFK